MSSDPKPNATVPLKERLKLLMDEYGGVALGTFLVLWALAVIGIWLGLMLGWRDRLMDLLGWKGSSPVGWLATLAVAYAMLKTTTIPRALITLALTPLVAKALERLGLRRRRS
jgi:hypothetical protein